MSGHLDHGLYDLQAFNVATVIRVVAYDAEDAQATVNAFLQRDDGELDDGTVIVAWRFPVAPVVVPEASRPEDAGLGGTMSVPGIPDGEVGRNYQKGGER